MNSDIKEFLDNITWPDELEVDTDYWVRCDDAMPDELRCLHVNFDRMGDAYIGTSTNLGHMNYSRFRTFGGGGCRHYTHQALKILATAIKMDMENEK